MVGVEVILKPILCALPFLRPLLAPFMGLGLTCASPSPEPSKPLVSCQIEGETRGLRFQAERLELKVPERRDRPSRSLTLPLLRIKATQPTGATPLFWLGGGPGAPNIPERVPAWAEPLLAHHDLVFVGYRGAEGSVVLRCPEIAQAIQGGTRDLMGPDMREHMRKAMEAAVIRFQSEGIDLAGYTPLEVMEDLETARQMLGYEQIHLVSESYGTRVAWLYDQAHPGRVHRSLMIGATPPGRFVWEPALCDAVVRRYGELWAQDPARKKRCGDLAAAMARVNARMPRRWMGYPIDPGRVKVVTFMMLYDVKTAALVLDAYAAANQGDASGLALMSMAGGFMLRKLKAMPLGDTFCKGMLDYETGRDYARDLDPAKSILGSPCGLWLWGPLSKSSPWPRVPNAAAWRQPHPSNTETLILSGNLDISTPFETAQREFLPLLPHGHQVVLSDMSHMNLRSRQPEALQQLVSIFMESGKVDASGFKADPMDFHVSWSLPTLAKLMACGVLALTLLVGWLVKIWIFV
jgi:pimeloyl-ACP methyl ester carboxylesterase